MDNKVAQKIKKNNEKIILEHGAEICDWLPLIEFQDQLRSPTDIINRALILNAMLNIYFKAPIRIIKTWIINNGLYQYISKKESRILELDNAKLSKQDNIDLFWNIEALWTFLWAGKIIDKLPFNQHVEDRMASLCPNIKNNEDGSKFVNTMKFREVDEIYTMLDLYYRLHWYTRNCQLTGKDSGDIIDDIVMERRKALEWIYNKNIDWDNVELGT